MEDKKNIFDYIRQLFAIYGVMVLIFIVINLIIGNEAGSVSTLFALGSKALSTATLLELFLLGVIVTISTEHLPDGSSDQEHGTDRQQYPVLCNDTGRDNRFCSMFGWFPLNNPAAWIGFIVSFSVCAAVSAFIMRLEENAENKKMQEALNRLKK